MRVAVPPRRERVTEAGLVLPPDEDGPFIGVVTQVGAKVRDLKPGVGVVFGSLVGQWVDGDLLIAETDCDAVLE